MSNHTHSPGPWHVKWERNSVYIRSADPDRDLSICRVMTHRNCNNVNILVNAPDMLAVLRYAETVLNMVAASSPDYKHKQVEVSLADLSAEIGNVLNKIEGHHAST